MKPLTSSNIDKKCKSKKNSRNKETKS